MTRPVLVRKVVFHNIQGASAMPEDNTYKAIGGRHFAPKGVIPQLKFEADGEVDIFIECENALATDDVAAISLSVMLNGDTWHVEGSAKRDPSDRPNRELGMALATARAMQRLADQMMRQASGKAKHADWIVLDRKLRREGSTASKWAGSKKKARKAKKSNA